MITLIHFKLMIFMLLNNCYLFIFIIYLFVCLFWLCWLFLSEGSLFWLWRAGATVELKCVDFSF